MLWRQYLPSRTLTRRSWQQGRLLKSTHVDDHQVTSWCCQRSDTRGSERSLPVVVGCVFYCIISLLPDSISKTTIAGNAYWLHKQKSTSFRRC